MEKERPENGSTEKTHVPGQGYLRQNPIRRKAWLRHSREATGDGEVTKEDVQLLREIMQKIHAVHDLCGDVMRETGNQEQFLAEIQVIREKIRRLRGNFHIKLSAVNPGKKKRLRLKGKLDEKIIQEHEQAMHKENDVSYSQLAVQECRRKLAEETADLRTAIDDLLQNARILALQHAQFAAEVLYHLRAVPSVTPEGGQEPELQQSLVSLQETIGPVQLQALALVMPASQTDGEAASKVPGTPDRASEKPLDLRFDFLQEKAKAITSLVEAAGPLSWSVQKLDRHLNHPDRKHGIQVATDDNRQVGAILYTYSQEDRRRHIMQRIVDPASAKRGVDAGQLRKITSSVGDDPSVAYTHVTAYVRESDLSNQLLYRSAGFRWIGTSSSLFNHPEEDGYVMAFAPKSVTLDTQKILQDVWLDLDGNA